MRPSRLLFSAGLGALSLASGACARGEPPTPASAAATTAVLAPALDAPSATPATVGRVDAAVAAAGVLHAVGGLAAGDALDAAPAVDPATLPQTREQPAPSGPAWDARVAALWGAIVLDDPERALPFFFPLPAYAQVKAIANPAVDWKRRLVAAYERDIHELHRKLGADAGGAKLVKLEQGATPRWVEPGEEYNKIGYWRVFGSRLRWERAGGKAEEFGVKSLISWRGEWFVVHLSGMK